MAYRILRYPLRMIRSVVAMQWIKLTAEISYLAGYLLETARGTKGRPAAAPAAGRMIAFGSPEMLPADPAEFSLSLPREETLTAPRTR